LIPRYIHTRQAFFKNTVHHSKLCRHLLELLHLSPKFLPFIAAFLPLGIPCLSLFARLQKLFAPFVVAVLVDAFSSTEFWDRIVSS
jgi:hypothetical protein